MLATPSEVGQSGRQIQSQHTMSQNAKKVYFRAKSFKDQLESFKIPLRIKAVPETDVKYLRKTFRWKLEKF